MNRLLLVNSRLEAALAAGLLLVALDAGGCRLDQSGLTADAQSPSGNPPDVAADRANQETTVDTFDLASAPDLAAAADAPADLTDTASDSGDNASDAPANAAGCADGTREGLLRQDLYPNVAACDGAWDQPGLLTFESRTPACDRRAGNDGAQNNGVGCSAADLCASGWHVCDSAGEVQADGGRCADATPPANGRRVFYVTRQDGACASGSDASLDDGGALHGCGDFGDADNTCLPQGVVLSAAQCAENVPWICGNGGGGDPVAPTSTVTKTNPGHGGVLCCRD